MRRWCFVFLVVLFLIACGVNSQETTTAPPPTTTLMMPPTATPDQNGFPSGLVVVQLKSGASPSADGAAAEINSEYVVPPFDKKNFTAFFAKAVGYPPALIVVGDPDSSGKVKVSFIGADASLALSAVSAALKLDSATLRSLGATSIVDGKTPEPATQYETTNPGDGRVPPWAIVTIILVLLFLLGIVFVAWKQHRSRQGTGQVNEENSAHFIRDSDSDRSASVASKSAADTTAAGFAPLPANEKPAADAAAAAADGTYTPPPSAAAAAAPDAAPKEKLVAKGGIFIVKGREGEQQQEQPEDPYAPKRERSAAAAAAMSKVQQAAKAVVLTNRVQNPLLVGDLAGPATTGLRSGFSGGGSGSGSGAGFDDDFLKNLEQEMNAQDDEPPATSSAGNQQDDVGDGEIDIMKDLAEMEAREKESPASAKETKNSSKQRTVTNYKLDDDGDDHQPAIPAGGANRDELAAMFGGPAEQDSSGGNRGRNQAGNSALMNL